MISIKPVSKNASFSIRDNFDPDSKATEERNPHFEKQFSPKNVIERGTMKKFRQEF
jgi:hypothetical protein